jgi:hypothetical protein
MRGLEPTTSFSKHFIKTEEISAHEKSFIIGGLFGGSTSLEKSFKF